MSHSAKVWTCGTGMLEELAARVLDGFPLPAERRAQFSLPDWTILVPTRRAARVLESKLYERCGKGGLVLPRIQPIGDIDEDLIEDSLPEEGVPDAISKTGQLFLLLHLIDEWANGNEQEDLAQDVMASRSQALGLAQSLQDLVNQIETEEVALEIGEGFRSLDLAEHRSAILSLLHLVQTELPQRLQAAGLIGPAARRNRMIRLEAERVMAGQHQGPIIAVGSTGTNPATRKLLAAIARHPLGAVVLPGLDLHLDEESWNAVGPEHPQHAMKILLAELEIARSHVAPFRSETMREHLLRETMRPSGTTEKWRMGDGLKGIDFAAARHGLRLIEAESRHQEARSIALIMRAALESPGMRVALVTPDRDLGQQVQAELTRFGTKADDSGGAPLIRFGRAQLAQLVMQGFEAQWPPQALVALLAHPLMTLGLGRADFSHLAQAFEIACLRQDLPLSRPQHFAADFDLLRAALAKTPHLHPIIGKLPDETWENLRGFVTKLSAALALLPSHGENRLAQHVAALLDCLSALAPADMVSDESDALFAEVMGELAKESPWHPPCSFLRATGSIRHALQTEVLRAAQRDSTRLTILGLPEARMIDADLVILGGLNEKIWPAAVDPGPWFNRSMRREIGLQQPERDIGVTAHDFAQGATHPNVVVTWAKRVAGEPVVPSRWILRLLALSGALGFADKGHVNGDMAQLAVRIDQPEGVAPWPAPKPAPPVAARPLSFSVTEIERLRRDPYAVYARRILALEPLAQLGGTIEPALRGSLFHEALGRYGKQPLPEAPTDREALLLKIGRQVFAPYMVHSEVAHFWWPRFRRMARAFIAEDQVLRSDVTASLTERSGKMSFAVAGVDHHLRARADRIDFTGDGKARIIDYKSGQAPTPAQVQSGLNPQLTLEAAMLMHGDFGADLPHDIADLIYVEVSGGKEPVKIMRLAEEFDVTSVSWQHLERLKELLAQFQKEEMPYIPRAALFSERETSDFDHLSRYAEWSLGGG